MARSLTSRQTQLSTERQIRPLPLVTLTTYTDRVAETVDQVYRLSTRDLTYGGQHWFPLVQRVERLVESMPHIPQPQGATGELVRSLQITFRNGELDTGEYLIAALQAGNMINARVEVSQLLLFDDEEGYAAIRDLAGTEHVVFYRGVLRQLETLRGGEFGLRFEVDIPTVPQFTLPDDASTAPKDRGKVVPIIYGGVSKLPLLNYSVGAQTTITSQLNLTDAATISLQCTDLSDFPTSGSGHLGAEAISWTGKTDNTLTGVTRGNQAIHQAGTVLIEEPTTFKAIVAQKGCSVDRVYMRNLVTGGLFPVSGGALDDDDEAPFGSGNGVTSLEFAPASIGVAIQSAIAQARVTAQAEYQTTGGGGATTDLLEPGIANVITDPYGWQSSIINLGLPSPRYKYGPASQQGLRFEIDSADVTGDTRVIVAARVKLRMVSNDHTFVPFLGGPRRDWYEACHAYGMTSAFGLADGTVLQSGVHTPGTYFSSPNWHFAEQTVDVVSFDLTPTPGLTVEDLGGVGFELFMSVLTESTAQVDVPTGFWGLEIETITTSDIDRVTDTVIAAAAGGLTLELWGDVFGPVVPTGKGDDGDGTYNLDAGVVIDRYPDALRHFIVEHCGRAYSDIDQTSFDSADTKIGANHDLAAWLNPPYRDGDFATIVGTLGFDFRSQLVLKEGSSGPQWTIQTPSGVLATNWYQTPVLITEWDDVEEIGRIGENVRTSFAGLYDLDHSLEGVEAYRQVAKADAGGSDLSGASAAAMAAAELKFGRALHPGFVFDSWGSTTPPIDAVLSYYVNNVISTLSSFRLIGVPWVEAYAIERGDVVQFTPAWRSSYVLGRVIGVEKDWGTNMVDLTVQEVGP